MKAADFARLQEWFATYCQPFYSGIAADDRNIALKEEHTSRVCANMEVMAHSLGLDDNDRYLAASVALFHDVGRFEQYRRYRTFKDSDSVNHAAFGAQVLADTGALRALPGDERRLIGQAVTLHNVFNLPAALDERLALFVRLIRDADKLDIWRVFIEYYAQSEEERASAVTLGFPDLPSSSSAILAAVSGGRMANLSQVVTLNDFKLLQLSWVYDLNFPVSFALAHERGYLRQLAANLPQDEGVRQAVATAAAFLHRRLRPEA
jgi:hypothetical protein